MGYGELAYWPALDKLTDDQLEREIAMAETMIEDHQHTIEQCQQRLKIRKDGLVTT